MTHTIDPWYLTLADTSWMLFAVVITFFMMALLVIGCIALIIESKHKMQQIKFQSRIKRVVRSLEEKKDYLS